MSTPDRLRKLRGHIGEQLASNYLITKGFLIYARNYRHLRAEIDIIAYHPHTERIHFVEVKTRTNLQFGMPEQHADAPQLERIKDAAVHYLETHNLTHLFPQYDIIAVILDKQNALRAIDIFEDVF